jgi:ABC-type phosphate transport system substrate-binding protein
MNRHHKRRRLAALAACAGSTAALAVLGFAGNAAASVTCLTPGFASGSSLQGTAQQSVWLTAGGWGAHTSCSTPSSITYTKTASGNGLEEFGNNTGELHPEEDPTAVAAEGEGKGTKDVEGKVLDWYVGTDDPPTQGQLSEAQTAAGAKHGLAEITIPVMQAPVAVLLSLPVGCKIESGSAVDLPNAYIGQLWEGTNTPSGSDPGGIQAQGGYAADTWGAFFTQLGYSTITSGTPGAGQVLNESGGCEEAIKPQVRETESGTSFAFKTYLAQINHPEWGQYASDFVNWPTTLIVKEDGGQVNDTGGHLAGNTAATPGSVGYANTADAVGNGAFSNAATSSTFKSSTAHQILWAEVQNNGKSVAGATFTDPLLPSSSIANCETSSLLPSDKGFPYSYTDSWAGIVATDPNIATDAGSSDYPLCALTYDLVWHHYSNTKLFGASGETAQDVANTVRDLFEYITGQGQIDIQSHDYTRFPTGFAAHIALAVNPGIGK